MRLTIYLYLITLVSFSRTHDAIAEISDECIDEIMENSFAAERCMDEQIGTPIDVLNRFKSAVFTYSYDQSDANFVNLIEVANKNCARMPDMLQCLHMTFKHTAKCPRLNKQRDDVRKMVYSGIEKITKYICADNFDVIRKLIPHNGLRFLLLSDDFDRCFEDLLNQNIDHVDEICPLIDIAAPCIFNVIGDHLNDNVLVVAFDIIKGIRSVAEC